MSHTPVWVRIRTDSAMDGFKAQPDIIKDIDWNDRHDRKWLDSHCHWAMMNLRQVTIYRTPTRETPSREARHG